MLSSEGISIPLSITNTANSIRSGGKVAVFSAINGRIHAVFGMSDTIRPDAAKVIEALHKDGSNFTPGTVTT